MALAGQGIARAHPLIPGIDLVGRVTASAEEQFSAGDLVVLNGDGIGESRHGGFATRARVRADALVRLPADLSPERAAAIGTAGFTAMLAVLRLEDTAITPDAGDVLVTGASGGAGSIAIALLAGRGHRVVASTGRGEEHGTYLRDLGAAEVIDRRELSEQPGRPLQSQRFAAAIDGSGSTTLASVPSQTPWGAAEVIDGRELSEQPGRPLQSQRFAAAIDGIGSTTLANVLAQTAWGGTVAAYGLVQGPELPTTVLPFILRGITLAGVNSVDAPLPLRERAWDALARELDTELLDSMTTSIGLAETIPYAEQILAGQVRGRTVVDVNL